MNLKLIRPLVFMDIEGTGLNRETDRIIEISLCIISTDGNKSYKTRRFNPGIPIPAASTEVHGITDADVINERPFRDFAKSLHTLIEGCDIAGFGSNYYDVPLLYFEFLRSGINWEYTKVNFIDVGNIFKIQEKRDLSSALKFYTGETLENAHSALADVTATVSVFEAQLNKYELPDTVEDLSVYSNYGNKMLDLSGKFAYNKEGEVIFNFGPKKGERALDNVDFLNWMAMKDFAPDTHEVCSMLIRQAYEVENGENGENLPW